MSNLHWNVTLKRTFSQKVKRKSSIMELPSALKTSEFIDFFKNFSHKQWNLDSECISTHSQTPERNVCSASYNLNSRVLMLNTLKTVLVESLSYIFVLISHDLYCSISKGSGTVDAQIINNTSSCMGLYEGFTCTGEASWSLLPCIRVL